MLRAITQVAPVKPGLTQCLSGLKAKMDQCIDHMGMRLLYVLAYCLNDGNLTVLPGTAYGPPLSEQRVNAVLGAKHLFAMLGMKDQSAIESSTVTLSFLAAATARNAGRDMQTPKVLFIACSCVYCTPWPLAISHGLADQQT
jgi:hypothetical protein